MTHFIKKYIFNLFQRWYKFYIFFFILFLFGIILGYIWSKLNNFSEFHPGQSGSFDIFINNLKVCLFLACGGALTAGVLSFFIIIFNGYIIGIVLHGVHTFGIEPILLGLLPHFFFELFAIFMCATIGVMPGLYILKILKKKKKDLYWLYIKDSTMLFIMSLIFLFISSLIEGYVSSVNI